MSNLSTRSLASAVVAIILGASVAACGSDSSSDGPGGADGSVDGGGTSNDSSHPPGDGAKSDVPGLDAPLPDSPVTVSVVVSPATATVAAGAVQAFTATVTGTADTSVTWSASGG